MKKKDHDTYMRLIDRFMADGNTLGAMCIIKALKEHRQRDSIINPMPWDRPAESQERTNDLAEQQYKNSLYNSNNQ